MWTRPWERAGYAFLCRPAGRCQVWAFDIQKKLKLAVATFWNGRDGVDRPALILTSHEHMDRYLAPESVDGSVFNFPLSSGRMPHRLQAETSVAAGTGGRGL